MKIHPKVVSDRFDDEIVVVHLETGFYYSFRKSAMQVWTMLEKGLSGEQLISLFNCSAEEQKEISEFISQLIDEKLIEASEHVADVDLGAADSINFVEIEFAKFEDMSDLIMIDPIHDTDQEKGWPHKPEN